MHNVRATVVVLSVLVAGMWGLLTGCAGQDVDATQPALAAALTPPIADVPIPRGFRMESRSSARVIPGSNVRIVDHYYKGHADLLPVVRFYRDRLPENGWVLTSQQQMPGDQFVLTYTKAHEDLAVSIMPGTFDMHIRVQIMPSARAGAAR